MERIHLVLMLRAPQAASSFHRPTHPVPRHAVAMHSHQVVPFVVAALCFLSMICVDAVPHHPKRDLEDYPGPTKNIGGVKCNKYVGRERTHGVACVPLA